MENQNRVASPAEPIEERTAFPALVGNALQAAGRGLLVWFVLRAIASSFSHEKSPSKRPDGEHHMTRGSQLVRENVFNPGELLDMWVYSSNSPQFREGDPDLRLLWHLEGVKLGEEPERSLSLLHPVNAALQNNGTAYLHAFFARSGMPHLPSDESFAPEAVFGGSHCLVSYVRPAKRKASGRLLSKDRQEDGEEQPPEPAAAATEDPVAHWKPNITIALVRDFTAYPDDRIPPQVRERLVFDPYSGNYYPPVWFNDFWLLREHTVPLNSTIGEVELHLVLSTANVFSWQLLLSMEQTLAVQKDVGAMGESDDEQLKRIFLDTNPYFLGLTIVVSLLHTVFDLLAFKSDIGFWNSNKSMEGLSARSVLIRSGCQVVIFLYLLDNDTSYVVLLSNGLALIIEFWKVTKAMKVSMTNFHGIPMLKFEDRASYSSSETKRYDAEATRYLSYVLYPLVLCYSVYTLLYESHKSWYSWVLNSLVGAVYMFGFILMCPQLYLNYKLKSVAHMPWRQMTYKFLNTIIDDLFAFVIKMPMLHRISVFRDDLIFFIFLYQRWVYRVDKTRVNEFGYSEQPAVDGTSKELRESCDPADDNSNGHTAGEDRNNSAYRRKGTRFDKTESVNVEDSEGRKEK